MAPSITETVTEPLAQNLYRLHLGQYKEIEAVHVDRAAEEGKTGLIAAKACLLDSGHAVHQLLTHLASILTISQHGTEASLTPL